MAKNKNPYKKLYKNLRKQYSEMSDHMEYLTDNCKRDEVELRYLREFICYEELYEEYHYFCENAREECEENMPFSRLTL